MGKISTPVIVWRNDVGNVIYDISTKEKEESAYLLMVEEMNNAGYYQHSLSDNQAKLLEEALAGNVASAYRLLSSRRHYEYESWHQEELINPIEMRALHKATKEIISESSKKRQKGHPTEGGARASTKVVGAKPTRAVDKAGRKRRPSAKTTNQDSGKNRRRRT